MRAWFRKLRDAWESFEVEIAIQKRIEAFELVEREARELGIHILHFECQQAPHAYCAFTYECKAEVDSAPSLQAAFEIIKLQIVKKAQSVCPGSPSSETLTSETSHDTEDPKVLA